MSDQPAPRSDGLTNGLPSRMTPDEILAAVAACDALAWKLAHRFRRTNPRADLDELHAVATAAFKVAALKFDTRIGVMKFSTFAFRAAWFELILYCRNESANGMHVASGQVYHAPPFGQLTEEWQHPVASDGGIAGGSNGLGLSGEEFWASVGRTLPERHRAVILRVFRDGLQQKDVAKELGVSKARAGQLVRAAVEKLKGREDLKALAGLA